MDVAVLPPAQPAGRAGRHAAPRPQQRRTARTDPVAARTLLPYAAWCLFATALNISLTRRNP
ncbi:tryptophan-rich sensory protein [Streptomyces vinaceus]|uniref:tryptophan-rich sensory protein n=1 Tax=Streptomyces vinaceus TaxID=1960 RepID=UPI0035DF362C